MKRDRFSSYFFLRSYVAIAAAILIIALALDGIMVWLLPEQKTTNAALYGSDLRILDSVLTDAANSSDYSAALDRLRAPFEQSLQAPLAVYEAADFANQAGLLNALQQQQVVSMFDSDGAELLYYLLADDNHVLVLGPLTTENVVQSNSESLMIIAYYALVACILFLWIKPFYRDLSALRAAASRFGHDDFSSRVEVDQRSSIRPVAESFNKMAERIQYLVTAHRDLTNAVSHELRTPLARFKFSLEILNKTQDVAKKAEYLASMKVDVQELEELIDEMLTYARLGEQNLQMVQTMIPLDKWLERQVAHYSTSPVQLVLQFYTVPPGGQSETLGNPDMLARALHNVLRNCLRYARSMITVSGELSQAMATIRVCDDGPGIPDDKHATVFEPFSRLDTSRDRQSGGYGLGLAIAQRALQQHGGNITVQNNSPCGACFVLQWPRSTPAPVIEPQIAGATA